MAPGSDSEWGGGTASTVEDIRVNDEEAHSAAEHADAQTDVRADEEVKDIDADAEQDLSESSVGISPARGVSAEPAPKVKATITIADDKANECPTQ